MGRAPKSTRKKDVELGGNEKGSNSHCPLTQESVVVVERVQWRE